MKPHKIEAPKTESRLPKIRFGYSCTAPKQRQTPAKERAYLSCIRQQLECQGFEPAEITQIIAASPPSAPDGGGAGKKPDIISLEEKFVIVTSGNVSPQWKLVRVSANQGLPLAGAGRTRTHDLVITIGPPTPATDTAHSNLVAPSQTGTAVRPTASSP